MSDQSEEVQLQLQVERRSFDMKDLNLNGALEGSELDAYLNPPDIKWYESEVMYLIGKMDRNDDLLLSKVHFLLYSVHIKLSFRFYRLEMIPYLHSIVQLCIRT